MLVCWASNFLRHWIRHWALKPVRPHCLLGGWPGPFPQPAWPRWEQPLVVRTPGQRIRASPPSPREKAAVVSGPQPHSTQPHRAEQRALPKVASLPTRPRWERPLPSAGQPGHCSGRGWPPWKPAHFSPWRLHAPWELPRPWLPWLVAPGVAAPSGKLPPPVAAASGACVGGRAWGALREPHPSHLLSWWLELLSSSRPVQDFEVPCPGWCQRC